MSRQLKLGLAALLVLLIAVPFGYAGLWLFGDHLSPNENSVLILLPPLVSLVLSGLSVIPGRSRLRSNNGDWLGVIVGTLSFFALVMALGFIGLNSIV
jgi:hypothetical protein